MPSHFGSDFDSILRWVRPLVPPFCLRTAHNLKDDDGNVCYGLLVQDDNERFTIWINRSLSNDSLWDTLAHELAHLIDITKRGWKDSFYKQHGRGWSDAYGWLYRMYHTSYSE